jgi:hypothetical protein
MARRTHPRSQRQHEVAAGIVLDRHASASGQPVSLPVPVDLIIERTMRLSVLWDAIDDPDGTMILGALSPSERRIVLNATHADLFETVVGPERFTLAHELGHWVYDADNPNQAVLEVDQSPTEQFCYHRAGAKLSETLRIREVNANKFASCLLLPAHLVRAENLDQILQHPRETAAAWGVSRQCLSIRLEDLGLLDNLDRDQLDLH